MTEYALEARLPDGSRLGHPLPERLGDPPTLADAMTYCGELLKIVPEDAEWKVAEQWKPAPPKTKETAPCSSS